MALIAATNTSGRTNAVHTFLGTVRLTFARHPFLFITRITATRSRGNTLAMITIEIANRITLIWISGIGFVAHKTATGVRSCTGAMYAGFTANGNAVIE